MSNRGPSTGTLSTAPGPVIPPERASSHAEASVTREAGDVPLTPVGLRLLTALYTTQFIGVGFLTVGLVAILREQGASLSTLGLVQLLGIIWPLKIFWAPLIDRYSPSPRNGHYRSWLVVLQTGMVISLLGLLFVTDPIHQLPMLVAVVALFVVMSATQDIAADAISVRGLAGRSRDMGSAVQVSASYLGTLIGGAGAVLVADHWGLRAAGVFLAAATGVALIPVLRFREHPGRVVPLSNGSFRRDYFGVFSDPECRRWCLVAMPLMYIGFAGVYSLVTPALTDVGFSLSEISLITLVVGAVPAIVAGMAAGYLDSRVSRRASVIGGDGAHARQRGGAASGLYRRRRGCAARCSGLDPRRRPGRRLGAPGGIPRLGGRGSGVLAGRLHHGECQRLHPGACLCPSPSAWIGLHPRHLHLARRVLPGR